MKVGKSDRKKAFDYEFYPTDYQPAVDIDEHTKNYAEISKYLKYQYTEKISDLQQLNDFPTVKNLFKKYNVIMPSEADVERLFSFGGMSNGSFYLFSLTYSLVALFQV